jgi:predicted nuclease of predicted toxin-antitoxin system
VAGRFPLFTDACVNGLLVDALVRSGWDVARAIDVFPEGTKDLPLFARAAQEGRVFVTNDGPLERIALQWVREGRPFRMIFWRVEDYRLGTIGNFVAAFEDLALREGDAFLYPIHYLRPGSK